MNLLVVDDSPTNRKLLRITLEEEGHTVLEAADGAEALAMLERHRIDAIVSDILMPNMDGYRLCHELRRSVNFKHIAFVHYTSTYTSPGDLNLSQTVGADGYLTKPASTQKLLRAIEDAIAKSEKRKVSAADKSDTMFVMKQYSAALIQKLEERNAELERTQVDLIKANQELARQTDKVEKLNAVLEERVRERTADLQASNRHLERRNAEIQNFYHTLSHELKTPLTSAREFISILLDGLAGPLNDTQTEHLAIALESCDQIRVCLNDLLDTTRLETGKFTIELKSTSLEELVRQAAISFGPQATAKRIGLKTNIQTGLPQLQVDPNRITQVIANLVNNAIKFTPEGGRIEINAGAATEPGFVQVSVRDTGGGIPVEEHDRIFDRLYQVKPGDAASGQGMGLGLYLCRQLVELHGGRITVASEPGKGSTFTFTLPITAADAK